MLTEICNYLKNWFEDHKYIGYITIASGVISCGTSEIAIQNGQYFRVIDSIGSDAVYKYGTDTLTDESFYGAVWTMRVPKDVIAIAAEIAAWMEKYGGVDSAAMSPYNSEAFGAYSYSKSSGNSSDKANNPGSWESVYGARLARYRKL